MAGRARVMGVILRLQTPYIDARVVWHTRGAMWVACEFPAKIRDQSVAFVHASVSKTR